MKQYKFKHRYHKLKLLEFTTIRGAAQFKLRKIGEIAPIETPDEKFNAEIVNLELRRVQSMTIEFLQKDTSYDGFMINSYYGFVKLLNSFRSPMWAQVEMDSELTVITLRRIK